VEAVKELDGHHVEQHALRRFDGGELVEGGLGLGHTRTGTSRAGSDTSAGMGTAMYTTTTVVGVSGGPLAFMIAKVLR
jgi:hypothetical protein